MNLTKFNLVTAAIKSTFFNENNFFIGKWCLINKKKENNDDNILEYHWDDNKKFEFDNQKIPHIYEEVLDKLANNLNHIHKQNKSKRFWRIVIGPWLYWFVSIVFDRYENIRLAQDKYSFLMTHK